MLGRDVVVPAQAQLELLRVERDGHVHVDHVLHDDGSELFGDLRYLEFVDEWC